MTPPLPQLLGPEALERITETFAERIREGLEADGREIRALPAFLPPPPPGLAGRALVLDVGGTNLRAAVVRLGPGGPEVEGLAERSLRENLSESLDARGFFALHAELAERLQVPRGLPVGYCFSYPSLALPDGDAQLIQWTKGLEIPGVEGERVGAGLRAALLARGLEPGPVRVLNDTVAALLGGASRAADGSSRHVGLIVGTGTNMASFFDAERAPKLGALTSGFMAVNLESGNFSPPGLSALDDALGGEAEPRGRQRFEKAVSGLYLPELYARARPQEAAELQSQGARALVDRAARADGPEATLAQTLLSRSAQLVATGLAALARIHGGVEPIHVLAEGGLFWSWPGYRSRVEETLAGLGPRPSFDLARMEHANLVGAAAAALVPR